MYKTLRNRRLSYNVAHLPPLCSGGTQVRHGAKMASKTDAVLRFFCLAKEKIVEGEGDEMKSSFTVEQRNRTNELEDHVWNNRERTGDPLPRHIALLFNKNRPTYLRCLMEMHDVSSSR
ncbi:uncharacterized protein LOC143431216 [Xylocopa sonorina]|uniref:uncharacterized protein LOC143431216 n=1 Tax=Xylocopa sonorina TaxID=1818115 RepID=UPI00403B36CF